MGPFLLEICGVGCGSREKVVKNLMFIARQIIGGGPRNFFFLGGGHLYIDTTSNLLGKFG